MSPSWRDHRCTTGSVEHEVELGYDDGTPGWLLGLAMGVLRAPGLHHADAKQMPIRDIHTYLVRPNKLADVVEESSGTTVGLDGQLFDLLSDVYERSDRECDIDITFSPSDDGSQRNACRDLILRICDADYIGEREGNRRTAGEPHRQEVRIGPPVLDSLGVRAVRKRSLSPVFPRISRYTSRKIRRLSRLSSSNACS